MLKNELGNITKTLSKAMFVADRTKRKIKLKMGKLLAKEPADREMNSSLYAPFFLLTLLQMIKKTRRCQGEQRTENESRNET